MKASDDSLAVVCNAVYSGVNKSNPSKNAPRRLRYVILDRTAVTNEIVRASFKEKQTSYMNISLSKSRGERPYTVIPSEFMAPDATPSLLPRIFRQDDVVAYQNGEPVPYEAFDEQHNLHISCSFLFDGTYDGYYSTGFRIRRQWWGYPFLVLLPPAKVIDGVAWAVSYPFIWLYWAYGMSQWKD